MTIAARLPYAEEGRLTVSTLGNWDFTDLRFFLDGIELCYGVLFGLDFLDAIGDDLDDPRRSAIDYADTALLTQLTDGWHSTLAARAAIYSERYGSFNLYEEERKFLETLRLSAYRWYPLGRPRIARIQMSSPGIFSFKGLGEPLRQLREFIKDLSYRNAQERQLGELEIEAARLFLKQAKKASRIRNPEIVDRSVLFLAEGGRRLLQLEKANKLPRVGDAIDADEPTEE